MDINKFAMRFGVGIENITIKLQCMIRDFVNYIKKNPFKCLNNVMKFSIVLLLVTLHIHSRHLY